MCPSKPCGALYPHPELVCVSVRDNVKHQVALSMLLCVPVRDPLHPVITSVLINGYQLVPCVNALQLIQMTVDWFNSAGVIKEFEFCLDVKKSLFYLLSTPDSAVLSVCDALL